MKIPLTNYLKPGAPKLYRHSGSLTGYAEKKDIGKAALDWVMAFPASSS